MEKIGKLGLIIGIVGGLGLGLMLGSDFSGRYITVTGGIFVLLSIVAMVYFHLKGK